MNQEDRQSYQLSKLEHVGPFRSPVLNTHRKERYVYHEPNGREASRLVKYLPLHSARAEVIGSTIFQVIGLKAPRTILGQEKQAPVVIMDDLSEEYTADLTYGEGGVFADPELRKQFQDALIPAILLGDYDRVAWNTLVRRDYQAIAFVDFGACLGSRAQGGYNGYPEHIDKEEIIQCISNAAQNEGSVNAAFKELIDIQDGQLIIKNPERLAQMVESLKILDDQLIDRILKLAEWPQHRFLGRRKNLQEVATIIAKLETHLQKYPNPQSNDHIKTTRALSTYRKIRDEYHGDFARYFSTALKSRRDDLLELFGKK